MQSLLLIQSRGTLTVREDSS